MKFVKFIFLQVAIFETGLFKISHCTVHTYILYGGKILREKTFTIILLKRLRRFTKLDYVPYE